MTDSTLALDNSLSLRENLLEKNIKSWQLLTRLEIKVEYNNNREATEILALSSVKVDKYEYLAVAEILPSD